MIKNRIIDTKTPFRLASPADPSISFDSEEARAQYMRSGDESLLRLDGPPTWFWCRLLGGRGRRRFQRDILGSCDSVDDAVRAGSLDLAEKYLKECCFKIENLSREGDSVEFPSGLPDDILDSLSAGDVWGLGAILMTLQDPPNCVGEGLGK
jgi:hypothetical protein